MDGQPEPPATGPALAELAEQFSDIARTMIEAQPGEQLALEQVLRFAAAGVPGS